VKKESSCLRREYPKEHAQDRESGKTKRQGVKRHEGVGGGGGGGVETLVACRETWRGI